MDLAEKAALKLFGVSTCGSDGPTQEQIDRMRSRVAEAAAVIRETYTDQTTELERLRRENELLNKWLVYVERNPNAPLLLTDNAALRSQLSELQRVLRDIRAWDHLDVAGDGPYWKKVIEVALQETSRDA